jgi:hypothetical protein
VRAQQSWPALSRKLIGGAGRRGVEVGIGEDDVGRLAAELEGDPLELVGGLAHDALTDRGGAGEADLAHVGVGDEPLPDDRALTGQHGEHALGDAGVQRELTEPDRRQGGELGRFEHDGVAGRERRGQAPARDRHREVPRHDDRDDPERLLEGHVEPTGDGDLPAEEALGCRGVVAQHVDHVADLPPGVADGVAGVRHLEGGEVVGGGLDGVGEPAQQLGTVGGADGAPGRSDLDGPRDGRVGLLDADEVDRGDDLLGGGVDDVVPHGIRCHSGGHGVGGHSLSKPRTRSQSVTAELKAASSTSAALT